MSICTVNELKNGCIDWTCEIINDQQFCLQKGDCKWKGPCSERLCFLASQTLNTFEGCQQYNTECTLDNAGKGCVQIPQLCQKIKIQQACRISLTNFKGTIVKKNCLWDGTQCVDFNCSTLDKTITTTSQCNSVISGCVSANPINQIVQGCMDLPQVCEERQSLDNCEVIRVGYPDCIWNSQQIYPNCVMRSCITAKIILSTFEFTSCNNYLNKCIANNDANGCMKKPERCYGLVESNCLLNSTILEDCYWLQNQNKCVEKKCDNFIGFKNHIECNSIMNTCTVNYNNNGCQQLQSTCTNYMSDAQCHFTLDQGKCIWTGFACRNSTCSDAPDSIEYDTDLECLAFPAVTEKCIVINKTGGMGCTSRQTDCSLYISKQQCNRTIASYINDCIWISQICIAKNQLTQLCGKFTTQDQCNGLQNQYLDYCSWYNNRCFGIFDKQIGTCGTQYGNQANCEFYNMGHNKEEMKIEKIDSTVFNCEQKDGFFVKPIDYYMCSPLKSTCYISWSNCQTLDGTCSLNNKATSCINKYANILRNVQISNNKRLVVVWQKYTPNICGLIAYGFDCAYYRALPSDLSHQDCQNCSSLCTVVLDGTGCQENLKFCSNYQNLMSCTYSQNGRCIWTGISCIQITDPKTQCSLINGNVESQNYNDCQKYNIGCSVNQNGSACIEKMKKCSDYSVSCVNPYSNTCNCNYADEGECILIGSSCLKKTCDTASSNSQFNTDAECSAYLPTCTVARLGGCQALSQCNTYLSQKQCKYNSLGQKCFWNPSQMNCVDLQCQNIEQKNLFDSHIKCFNIDSKLQCTVRAIQGQINLGCQVRMNCKDYKIQEQCHYDAQGQECEWINNNTCFDKSCSTAPIIFSTHNECQSYLIDQKCTVAAKIDFEGDEYILQGCQPLVDCKKYKVIEQCIIDTQGQQCAWMENQCINKQCSTAPYLYSTDEECQQYLNSTCITNYFNNGCITIPIKCENVKTQIECVKDKQGNKCFWNKSNCITRTCQNATEDIIDEQGCQQFMNGCSYTFEKCRTQICQDFQFKTDDECTKAMKSCTSDGVTCVKRGKCEDAQAQAGCVSAIDGTPCQWIQPGQCTIKIEKSCVKAPITFLTDSNCSSYLKSCTVKQGGGCIQKSNCENITYKEACYTALDGTQCLWINNSCISNNCNKLGGNNHNDCQVQNKNCTIGYNRQCTQIQLCKNTELQEACILGLDGPCKWIDQYINEQQKKGGCFLYYGCSSFQWKTDKECKMISHQCTTNGIKCIGITTCSKTNTNGGCVTGIDGDCIQFIASLASTGPAVCKPYTSCADAFYLTHTACQTASSKCTTNGSTGCIPLAGCSSYAQPGCVYNNVGVVQSSGAVISTGDCTWDTKALACRDKNCQDLVGTTHSQCYSQLSTCTSDGTNCLVKGNCSTYQTQTACAAAMGSDGTCYWEAVSATNTTAKCRMMVCLDIPNGTSLQVCQTALSSCVSDGTNCISKANCQTYNRKTACNSGGSDGICVFAASTAVNATAETGSCSLMTACTVANNDQTACTAAKDRCKWLWLTTTINGKNSTTTTSCTTHTCESYQTTNGVCSRYFSWDKKTQQVCTTFNATCTATDPSTLPYANCFSLSGFTYTWNYAINQCDICRDDVAKNNTPNPSNTNTTTGNTTTSGYILGFASVVLGYLVF